MPKLGRLGAERGRFAFLGFGTTFLGVFVSATGTLLAPFVASATPDRHNHVATLGALMTITHIAKLVAFGFIGFAIGSFVPLMAAMIATGAVGNWLGEVALHRPGAALSPRSAGDPRRAGAAPALERGRRGRLVLIGARCGELSLLRPGR